LVLFAAHAVALDASAEWELRILWALISGASAVLFVSLAVRPALALYRPGGRKTAIQEAPFAMLQAMAVSSFFCIAIGVAPGWLYNLLPSELAFRPYALDRLAQQVEVLGFAGAVFLLIGGARPPAPSRLLDMDALYSGPVAAAGRWLGVMMLRVHGSARAVATRLGAIGRRVLARLVARLDQPHLNRAASASQLLAIAALLIVVLVGMVQ
jgi:multicomponent Na+:H+ antiporter subunit D